MKLFEEKNQCCGCTACANVCTKDAITMKTDEEGFLYPSINENLCSNCGQCIDVCPFKNSDKLKVTGSSEIYAAKHKSIDIRKASTSGGAFTAISDEILKSGGVVYGADFDKDFKVIHKRATTEEERNAMRISKYSQSDMGHVLKDIKKDLEKDITVLFTGTPCQNAAVKSYINKFKLEENLILCDVICYGIPSPMVWKDFKELLEKENESPLSNINFRTKNIAWNRFNSKRGFNFKTTKDNITHIDNRFYDLFFKKQTIMRPSCEKCKFTSLQRVTDITIADYWGIEKFSPKSMDPLGVSIMLVNTEKGKKLFNIIKENMIYEKRPAYEALTEQKRLSQPVKFPEDRDEFWKEYLEKGIEYILNNN